LKPLPAVSFAKNDVGFVDPTGVDHAALGIALNKALYNYMHGLGLDQDVRSWFAGRVPRTQCRGTSSPAPSTEGLSPHR